MTTKKGQMKDHDASEQLVRDNATQFFVLLYRFGTRERYDTKSLESAKQISIEQLNLNDKLRTAMVYAGDQYNRFVLVGTFNKNKEWKPVVPQHHK